jgi:hypothetical protein
MQDPVAYYGFEHPMELKNVFKENLCDAHCCVGMTNGYKMSMWTAGLPPQKWLSYLLHLASLR